MTLRSAACFLIGLLVFVEGASPQTAVSATDQQIQKAQEHVRKSAGDYAGYDELGSAFLQKARETGDVAYFDLAEKTLVKCLDLAPRDFRTANPLVHLALVYMGEHRFADALATTQKAIALGSGNLPAFAIEGDAYTDQGEYADALAAYNTVRTVGESFAPPLGLAYMLDSRMAYLSFLNGDSEHAIELMKSAILAGQRTNVPRENLAWLYFELGERYFQSGDLANADLSYRAGIAADPNHYRSLAGLGKVRAAQENWAEAIQFYQRSIDIIPFPQYVAELGDVYTRCGKSAEARLQYDLVEYIGHLSKLNQVLANRELALFYADRGVKLPEALDLARKELDVRHDIYTWDTLAWVLFKNGRMPEAEAAMHKALLLKTNDSQLLYHAGMIAHAAGNDSFAREYLEQALKLNPRFHVLYSKVAARALDELSHPAATERSLTKAAK